MADRPLGRDKQVSEGGSGVHRRDPASGGPVGGGHGPSMGGGNRRPDYDREDTGRQSDSSSLTRSKGSRMAIAVVIAIIVIVSVIRGRTGSLSSFLENGGSASQSGYVSSSELSGWENGADNTGTLDTTVVGGAREKYTQVIGNGSDEVTVLIYLCGTDLESKSAMATRDLQEMARTKYGDQVNVIVYTGGCKKWNNKIISSKNNQIYQVQSGGLKVLDKNMGQKAMTDPDTLEEFLKWGKKNFPANRYELILWDHGSGSNTGYGYDEKNPGAGAMDLAEISTALKNSGMKFDFVGFDACLMASVENGLMLSSYADYMIASEETEPGIGWYYTDWLTALGENPSISTPELGKVIADSFTQACKSSCRGQSTTLSVTDLAELSYTVPARFSAFSQNLNHYIDNGSFDTISTARSGAREFAGSSRIDQIDLTHFCKKINNSTGNELANAILGAVKYNRTSSDMTNSYGLSVYFPYRRLNTTPGVSTMTQTYRKIGMDEDYTKLIQNYAAGSGGAQTVFGGQQTPQTTLFDLLGGSGSSGSFSSGSGGLSSLPFGTMVGSGSTGHELLSQDTITSLLTQYLSGRNAPETDGLNVEKTAEFISTHQFDTSALVWEKQSDGTYVLPIEENQWELIHELDLNMYYDDGEGYVDLGCDNVFDFDDEGRLIAPTDRTWISINDQIVSYYRIGMSGNGESYTITGRVPAELNGVRVNLIVVFDTEHPKGYVAGASYDYKEGETFTVAKNLTELKAGDRLDFLCDFYRYDGTYDQSYHLGETMTLTGGMEEMVIKNQSVGDGGVLVSFKFTDLFGENYWTPGLVVKP